MNWTGTAVDANKVADSTSASTTVTMDGNYTLVANFAIDRLDLTVSSTKGGVVWMPGLGTFTYDYYTVVYLYAVPEPGYVWAGWTGAVYSTSAMESFAMTVDPEVRAHFISLRDTLYVDDNAPSDPGPGDPNVSDPLENGSPEHPFDSIQEAIDVAGDQGAAIYGLKSCPVLVNSIVWGNVHGQIAFDDKSLPAVSYMDIQGGWAGTGNLDMDPLFALPGHWAYPSNLSQPIDVDPRGGTAVWVPGDYHLMSKGGR